MPELTLFEFRLVYNMLSLSIAAMLGSFLFFVLVRGQLPAKYHPAMVMSAIVVAIAGYHYFRIFHSWEAAYSLSGDTYIPSGKPFNDAYRYVDWFLTVPLLVTELVSVMALPGHIRKPLTAKLVIASALMIALGYPGEIASGTTRVVWGLLSTVPFVYILYVLWAELGKVVEKESDTTRVLFRNTRLLLLATWGFYPIAYLVPLLGLGANASSEVALQVGYSVADITAKCGYGIMIYHIAKSKAADEAREAVPHRAGQYAPAQ